MMGPVIEEDQHLKRTVHSLSVLHQSMNLIIGLHSLLNLQYTHEGHMDTAVFDMLDLKLHELESELSDVLGRLVVEDLPF